MVRMIDSYYYDRSVYLLKECGVKEFYFIIYINFNVEVKVKVVKDDGVVCMSCNVFKIFNYVLK